MTISQETKNERTTEPFNFKPAPTIRPSPNCTQGHLNAGKKLIDPKREFQGDGPSHYNQPLPPAGTPQTHIPPH